MFKQLNAQRLLGTIPRRHRYKHQSSPKAASEALQNYHSKVRGHCSPLGSDIGLVTTGIILLAFPFAFSAEEAISHIGSDPAAANDIGNSNKEQQNVSKVFASLLTEYFPQCGLDPRRPTHVQPVYFPGWFISAELEATIWRSSEFDTEGSHGETATVQFEDLFLPGTNMSFGRGLVRDPPTNIELAQPFSPDLEHQWGLDVTCLPYNILPFDIFDRARTLPSADAIIGEGLRFNPQSVRMRIGAAYPVLLPVYLLEYVPQGPMKPVGVMFPAHGNPGVHFIQMDPPDTNDSVQLPFEGPVAGQGDGVDVEGAIKHAEADIRAIVVNPKDNSLSDKLSSWLTSKYHQPDVIASMTTREPIDMEDPRIREWTGEEVDPVVGWLRLDRTRAYVSQLRTEEKEDEDKSEGTSMERGFPVFSEELADPIYNWLRMDRPRPPGAPEPASKGAFVGALFQLFRKTEPEWQAFRAKLYPSWWREWQENQKQP